MNADKKGFVTIFEVFNFNDEFYYLEHFYEIKPDEYIIVSNSLASGIVARKIFHAYTRP